LFLSIDLVSTSAAVFAVVEYLLLVIPLGGEWKVLEGDVQTLLLLVLLLMKDWLALVRIDARIIMKCEALIVILKKVLLLLLHLVVLLYSILVTIIYYTIGYD
jgi:hypothetical protein